MIFFFSIDPGVAGQSALLLGLELDQFDRRLVDVLARTSSCGSALIVEDLQQQREGHQAR